MTQILDPLDCRQQSTDGRHPSELSDEDKRTILAMSAMPLPGSMNMVRAQALNVDLEKKLAEIQGVINPITSQVKG